MSAFRNVTFAMRRSSFVLYRFSQRAGLQTSAGRLSVKESELGNEERAKEVEEHKQDLLRKQKEGKGHWKEPLASDSESIIKADRDEIDATEETIKQLQKETERTAEHEYKK
ncbi:uncharacterized protein K441DRAFT_665977 [Cenococcum geophilum 1.58]|uniref:uncharacterized protein n=1 Tax=Cenococcum geophilum 1.58 TaxID=794803 RepID=UPI00358E9AC7|nr:hypothetical protein K441DRAFT_665977 [Cenococcum geophilum 1.58]